MCSSSCLSLAVRQAHYPRLGRGWKPFTVDFLRVHTTFGWEPSWCMPKVAYCIMHGRDIKVCILRRCFSETSKCHSVRGKKKFDVCPTIIGITQLFNGLQPRFVFRRDTITRRCNHLQGQIRPRGHLFSCHTAFCRTPLHWGIQSTRTSTISTHTH